MEKKVFKKKFGYTKTEKRRALTGLLFLLPWIVGISIFFIRPIIQTFIYSVNDISNTGGGFAYDFIGFDNYHKLLFENAEFIPKFVDSIWDMLQSVPVIVFFSFFTAIVLKNKFFGRTTFRAIFFMPVIIASGVVITVLKENVMAVDITSSAVSQSASIFSAPSFAEIFANLSVPQQLLNFITDVVNKIFDLTWKSGVQILLLLAAVNSIPASAYEASDIEGATGWEKFWKITFPLITPTLLVTVIYTIIDTFTDYNNEIIQMIRKFFVDNQLGLSSAVGFVYFLAILVIIGIFYAIMSRFVFFENN